MIFWGLLSISITSLFLILGAISFAVPNYVNTTKIKSAGYEITTDDEDIFSYAKATKEVGISIALYPVTDTDSKAISDAVKTSAPDEVKFISSLENKRAYVNKFKDGDIIVSKFTDREFVEFIDRASGIIVETGGLTSHAAIIALHFDIPTIIGAENATNIIKDGQLVTIDTVGGLVYDGDVKVL